MFCKSKSSAPPDEAQHVDRYRAALAKIREVSAELRESISREESKLAARISSADLKASRETIPD